MNKLINAFKGIGPGPLVAAAFIGPGTVAVCSQAGVGFSYALLWALLVSIVICIVFQEMAARLGVITGNGLAEAIRNQIDSKTVRAIILFLTLSAIVIGNAAYEGGNIVGGSMGMEILFGEQSFKIFSKSINPFTLILGTLALILLLVKSYKIIERALIALVIIMSLAFLISLFLVEIDFQKLLAGLFTFTLPNHSFLTVIALIGTTVVPYNLFLHASLASKKWKGESGVKKAKKDTVIAIVIGGLVSMSIVISAAESKLYNLQNPVQLAEALSPIYGEFAKYLIAIGLVAAGLTSAVTAPLAAGFVAKGCFNLNQRMQKGVVVFVLLIGIVLSSLGIKPLLLIQFAQISNAILLPLVAFLLLWMMNRKEVLGTSVNSKTQNILGFIVLIFALGMSIKSIYTLL